MKFYWLGLMAIVMLACQKKELPYMGRHEINKSGDTVYHTVGDFKLLNQDSAWVGPDHYENKIFVADFFFTSCPDICPIMATQMLRVYNAYQDNDQIGFLSHTIDPEYDTPQVLREYANRLGVTNAQWQFVTGPQEDIYQIAQKYYMVTATDDPDAPRGVIHSGAFILVDKNKRIRGIYDGTKPEKVDLLLSDLKTLLKEG